MPNAQCDVNPRKNPISDWPFLREIILFVGGVAGIAYETIGKSNPDPSLLVVFAGMMGLPIMLHKDERG